MLTLTPRDPPSAYYVTIRRRTSSSCCRCCCRCSCASGSSASSRRASSSRSRCVHAWLCMGRRVHAAPEAAAAVWQRQPLPPHPSAVHSIVCIAPACVSLSLSLSLSHLLPLAVLYLSPPLSHHVHEPCAQADLTATVNEVGAAAVEAGQNIANAVQLKGGKKDASAAEIRDNSVRKLSITSVCAMPLCTLDSRSVYAHRADQALPRIMQQHISTPSSAPLYLILCAAHHPGPNPNPGPINPNPGHRRVARRSTRRRSTTSTRTSRTSARWAPSPALSPSTPPPPRTPENASERS